ncbi:hypothetical protein L1887_18225 [Cichorium endivia]|nr:hypothetical protein L1887_18225 [Cichorium endivia]
MFTRVAGTQFYLDPTYHESRILRKESDVYSFGVVLFEMLSGMLVYSERTTEDDRSEILMTSVRRHNQNEPDKLIDPDIKLQMDTRSFDLFIQIAYQCISFNFKDRPRMETVIVTLEEALNIQENAGPVIEFISEDMGFSFGKPVAAFTIYKCLLNWNYLEAEGTTIFDRLIQLIMKAYEDLHKYDYMAFWLSNTSTLLFLIRKSLEVHGASSVASSVAQLLGRVKRGLGHKLDEDNAELNVVKHIEGKNPAFVFMQQLTTCVDKIYQIICDSMKKELQPLLAFYIQAPAATVYKDSPLYREHVIYAFLKVLLGIFKKKFIVGFQVPPVMVQMIFAQIFSYIDDEILKSMLSLKCVEYRNVEYIMAALAELEQWCSEAGNEYARLAWEIPMLTRRVISEVIEEREKRKVFHSFTLYLKASEIINQKGGWVRKEANDGSKSIEILHTKSRIHFSIDDLFTSLQVKDFAKVKPVVELSNYGGFRLKIGHKHIMFGHGIE